MQLLPSPFENGGSPDRALELHGGSPDHALEVDSSPEGPPHPSNYMEILDMLQRVSFFKPGLLRCKI